MSPLTHADRQRTAVKLLGLGALAGVLSTGAVYILPIVGSLFAPGVIYALLVLIPWAVTRQRLHAITAVATIILSAGGYFVAVYIAYLVVMAHSGGAPPPWWPAIIALFAAAGIVGLSLALVPLLITGPRSSRYPMIAAVIVAGFAAPLFVVIYEFRPFGAITAFIIWQSCTAYALGFAPRRQPDPLLCAVCGYNLRGNTTGQCPECGHTIPPDQQQHLAISPTSSSS